MQFQIEAREGGKYGVIVVGAGPAGVSAAITAARQGAKVLLMEKAGRVGGMATSGMINQFVGTVGNPLYREVLTRLASKKPFDTGCVNKYIDSEQLTLVFLEMLAEAGVELLLHTSFCKAWKTEDRVVGVLCHEKSGFVSYTAGVTVDATGDGDVAADAGAAYVLGRESDGKMQPATLMVRVGGVDGARAVYPDDFEDFIQVAEGELQELGRQQLPHPAGHVLLHKTNLPGVVACNMTNATGVDGTTSEGLTRAELVCRGQIPAIVAFLRRYVPGYEACYALDSASAVGVRETRHFRGMETLTERDVAEARQWEDYVVWGAHFNFDMHSLTGAGLDETGCQRAFRQTEGYTIPYGCFVPLEVNGLLLAGRCISGTHVAHSSYRAMPICIGMGEAVGAAAAICAETGKQPREITAQEVRERICPKETP